MAPGVEHVTTERRQETAAAADSSSRDGGDVPGSARGGDDLSPELRKKVAEYRRGGPFGLSAPVVWVNVAKMSVLHLLALGGVVVSPWAKFATWLLYPALFLVSGLGVTAGAHRLWAHKSYKARLPLRIVLMCFNCLSMQNDILEWSRDHRVHHKFSETTGDPHNAKRGFFFAHIGWLLMRKHPDVLIKGRNVDISDLKQDPVVMFQHNYYLPLCFLFTVLLPVIIPWYFWGENPWLAFLVLFAFRYIMVLHSTWLVNSAAHLWGSRNYDKRINPSDNRFVAVAAIGEGYHNYHHTFPYDYSTSEWGPSINVTTILIDLCASVGLVYDRKQVSQESIKRVRNRVGNLS